MANIEVRKGNGGQAQQAQPSHFEPLRWMRDLLRWDPYQEVAPIWRETERAIGFVPAFELKETNETYQITADMPGVKADALEVNLTGNRLSIRGKREAEKEEKSDTFYVFERSYGSFMRAFTLPEGIDFEHIHADLKDGVLNLILPKKPEVQPRKIDVKTEVKAKE
jgi:HSP20 family protein